jgi:peptide/nickel transport system substrate-binding protein
VELFKNKKNVLNMIKGAIASLFAFFKKDSVEKEINFDVNKHLVYSLSNKKIPSLKQLKHYYRVMLPWERIMVFICAVIIVCGLAFISVRFLKNHIRLVPIVGGDYSEALVGTPQYINPLYDNLNDVDSDLAALIYSRLFTYNENGQLQPDLAISYEVDSEGKNYTVTLRNDVKWHNGAVVTVDDVLFTFEAIKDGNYKSSLLNSFIGVEAEKVSEEKIKFSLAEPYAAFPNLLTFGILPQELWSQISPEQASLTELNLKPIGSGPYQFKSLSKNKNGEIKNIVLEINPDYYNNKPYIKTLTFKFFPTIQEAIDALNNTDVDGLGYLPHDLLHLVVAKDSLNIHRLRQTQLSLLFFNQDKNRALSDKTVRQALAQAINRPELLGKVLQNEGYLIDGPMLPGSFAYKNDLKKIEYNIIEATKILAEGAWKKVNITDKEKEAYKIWQEKKKIEEENKKEDKNSKNKTSELESGLDPETEYIFAKTTEEKSDPSGEWLIKKYKKNDYQILSLNIKTSDSSDNGKAVEEIKSAWEKLGVRVNLEIIPADSIQKEVISDRNFETLLYSQTLGSDPDAYVFWHSSQKDGGLNIINYDNAEVDKLLEEARLTIKVEDRFIKYQKIQELIIQDQPVVFLYSPYYLYLQKKKVNGLGEETIFSPSDRFNNITSWYLKTSKRFVW